MYVFDMSVLALCQPHVSLFCFSLQVINTGVKVWSRNSDGEEFGCAFRLAQEVNTQITISLTCLQLPTKVFKAFHSFSCVAP